MKSKFLITGVLYLLLVSGGISNAQESTFFNNMIVEKMSKFQFGETVEILTNEAKQRSWNIPVVHDLQKSLAKAGKNVRPVTVIEICKPEYSAKILELNFERIISVLMPCRISVYEKNDGKTYVALIDGGALSMNMPENIAAVMQSATDEILEIIKKTTESN
jgi:uncharacterized protein (DUF302 family)